MATNPKAEKAADKTTEKTYVVVSPLHHGRPDPAGKAVVPPTIYAVGDEVELTDAEAAPLLGHTVQLKA